MFFRYFLIPLKLAFLLLKYSTFQFPLSVLTGTINSPVSWSLVPKGSIILTSSMFWLTHHQIRNVPSSGWFCNMLREEAVKCQIQEVLSLLLSM